MPTTFSGCDNWEVYYHVVDYVASKGYVTPKDAKSLRGQIEACDPSIHKWVTRWATVRPTWRYCDTCGSLRWEATIKVEE